MNFVSCKLCRFNNVRWAPIQRHPLMSESGQDPRQWWVMSDPAEAGFRVASGSALGPKFGWGASELPACGRFSGAEADRTSKNVFPSQYSRKKFATHYMGAQERI
jgi:hypothetical protein